MDHLPIERQNKTGAPSRVPGVPIRLQNSLTPQEEFEAIDSFLKSYESQVKNWPAVAQACLHCKERELYKYGGYHSWHEWVQKAAPVSARTVFYYVGLFDNLRTDFTEEEMNQIPVQTAKHLRQLSSPARKDPKIRAAATKKPREFVKAVMEARPMEHFEGLGELKIEMTVSQKEKIEECFDLFKILHDDLKMNLGDVLEGICVEWLQGIKGETDGHSG